VCVQDWRAMDSCSRFKIQPGMMIARDRQIPAPQPHPCQSSSPLRVERREAKFCPFGQKTTACPLF
jgi:hypothetical protein